MNDKIVGVCESGFGFSPSIITENQKTFREIDTLSTDEKKLIGYTVEKVKIDSNKLDFFIEYTDNLERYMEDNDLEFHEAVENICKEHDLLRESVIIVVDESCIDKLDLVALSEKYNVRRK